MPRLQTRAEKLWAGNVLSLLERGDETQANLARLMGKPRSALQHFLCGRRHPTVETVHGINAAMGELFRNQDVTAYLESLIADSIDGLEPFDYNISADADGGFMRGINVIAPYLRDEAFEEIMQAWRDVGAPAGLFHDVNRAWRREVIRRIDGTVPQKLFVDEIIAIFQKHGIPLPKWFKADPEVRKYRALGNVIRVIRLALERTGAPVALRNELEGTIIPAVLNLVHDGQNYDLFGRIARGSKQ